MLEISPSILNCIGNTPLIPLQTIVPENCARIFIKLEANNPTGSMKDRMALAIIEAAELEGVLNPGSHVIEYTGGSTGVSLAMICAAKGYHLHIVTSDAFSLEKRNHMRAFGAKLTVIPSKKGGMDEALTRNMIAAAEQITRQSGGFWCDQLNNEFQLAAYHRMGEEIWEQTCGKIDAFVQSTGTAASMRGVSELLRRQNPAIQCIAVEPAESAVLSGGVSGVHKIEGVGAGFVVPLWKPDAVDRIMAVSTDDAMAMARRLADLEGIFAGTSTGANLCAAIRLGRKLGPEATIATVMCDSGMKYLSTPLFKQTA